MLTSKGHLCNSLVFKQLARRTGRFPQLVDPRSSVNGLFLTGSPGFRAVSLEERSGVRRSSRVRPLTHPARVFTGQLLTVDSPLKARQPRQFIRTRATVGSIDRVDRFHEPRTSRPFDVGWRRQQRERAACA
jgi:hypothetical protein